MLSRLVDRPSSKSKNEDLTIYIIEAKIRKCMCMYICWGSVGVCVMSNCGSLNVIGHNNSIIL